MFVVFGALFVFASLGAACLDYAGEETATRCVPEGSADAGAGSGADVVPVEKQPDCGVPVVTGTGSGSGS